jgi:hypothetical protein
MQAGESLARGMGPEMGRIDEGTAHDEFRIKIGSSDTATNYRPDLLSERASLLEKTKTI